MYTEDLVSALLRGCETRMIVARRDLVFRSSAGMLGARVSDMVAVSRILLEACS